MLLTLYILYAIIQAILIARYGMKLRKQDEPIFLVTIMTIFAPFVSVISILSIFHFAITWLVTYKREGNE